MAKMVFRILFLGVLALGFLNLTGCETNIFEWAGGEEEKDHMQKGLELMREAKYEEAKLEFEQVPGYQNKTNADALYYHAKATFHAAGIDIVNLADEMADAVDDTTGSSIPFATMSTEEADTLYTTNLVIVDDLKPIFRGQATGVIDSTDIALDLSIATGVTGALRFRDTNNDGRITDADIPLTVKRGDSGYTISGIDDLKDNPEDINAMIESVDDLLDVGSDAIESFIASMTDTTAFDPEDMDSVIDLIREGATWYYVNTGVPGNPGIGDNDGDGRTDEETLDGTDEDGDGLVDEDAVAPDVTPGYSG